MKIISLLKQKMFFLSKLLIFTMLFWMLSIPIVSAGNITFTDISNHWAKTYIESLSSKGVINGYDMGDGTYEFRPDQTIIRAEFMKILTVAFGVYNPNATYPYFIDVTTIDWFYPYIASAVKAGLASENGIGNNEFGSYNDMKREEMVTFTSRGMVLLQGYSKPSAVEISSILTGFQDEAQISDYAKENVALCVKYSLVSGYSVDGGFIFSPQKFMTRAEVSKIMDVMLSLPPLSPTPTPTPTPISTPTPIPTPTPIATPTPVATPTPKPIPAFIENSNIPNFGAVVNVSEEYKERDTISGMMFYYYDKTKVPEDFAQYFTILGEWGFKWYETLISDEGRTQIYYSDGIDIVGIGIIGNYLSVYF